MSDESDYELSDELSASEELSELERAREALGKIKFAQTDGFVTVGCTNHVRRFIGLVALTRHLTDENCIFDKTVNIDDNHETNRQAAINEEAMLQENVITVVHGAEGLMDRIAEKFEGCNGILVLQIHVPKHVVLLILDRTTSTMEWYDPHGPAGDLDEKRKALRDAFMLDLQEFMLREWDIEMTIDDTFNSQACIYLDSEAIGIQAFDDEEKEKGKGEIGGYCCYWSALMTELRVKYPDEGHSFFRTIQEEIISPTGRMNGPVWFSATDFIRQYARGIFEDMARPINKSIGGMKKITGIDVQKIEEDADSVMDYLGDGWRNLPHVEKAIFSKVVSASILRRQLSEKKSKQWAEWARKNRKNIRKKPWTGYWGKKDPRSPILWPAPPLW